MKIWTSFLFVMTKPNHVLNHVVACYLAVMLPLQAIVFDSRQNN